MKSALNARLLSAAELTRQDAIFADIGTDHAYLPLFLLDEGRIEYAYCSDVNEGPLSSARRNARERGREEQMQFILTDGASALSGKGITDYAICGMGGELIADIIDRAPHLKDASVNLILQPMTRQEKLRSYLCASGFEIISESYSFDAGKYYLCILASYTGVCRGISAADAIVGLDSSRYINTDCRREYLKRRLASLERAAVGRADSGAVCDEDLRTIAKIKETVAALG